MNDTPIKNNGSDQEKKLKRFSVKDRIEYYLKIKHNGLVQKPNCLILNHVPIADHDKVMSSTKERIEDIREPQKIQSTQEIVHESREFLKENENEYQRVTTINTDDPRTDQGLNREQKENKKKPADKNECGTVEASLPIVCVENEPVKKLPSINDAMEIDHFDENNPKRSSTISTGNQL